MDYKLKQDAFQARSEVDLYSKWVISLFKMSNFEFKMSNLYSKWVICIQNE